jgi:hypothetical protein
LAQIFSTPCSQTPSVYVPLLLSETMFGICITGSELLGTKGHLKISILLICLDNNKETRL